MQIKGDMKCMQTNFGGHGLSGFGDIGPFSFAFKNDQNFPLIYGSKIELAQNSCK